MSSFGLSSDEDSEEEDLGGFEKLEENERHPGAWDHDRHEQTAANLWPRRVSTVLRHC